MPDDLNHSKYTYTYVLYCIWIDTYISLNGILYVGLEGIKLPTLSYMIPTKIFLYLINILAFGWFWPFDE
jgi:hypothetical protein